MAVLPVAWVRRRGEPGGEALARRLAGGGGGGLVSDVTETEVPPELILSLIGHPPARK